MTPRARADVFRRAAKSIERDADVLSCIAVFCEAPAREAEEMSRTYNHRFAPGEPSWYDDAPLLRISDAEKAGGKEWRITALLFAAAMAETGDL